MKGDLSLESDDRLVDSNPLRWSEGGLKNWTEMVKEGLDLAALGVAVRVSHVQDLEEPLLFEH